MDTKVISNVCRHGFGIYSLCICLGNLYPTILIVIIKIHKHMNIVTNPKQSYDICGMIES